MDKLILIDGNSLLNRAYYATPVFTTQDGTPTNGVFGFVKLLLKIIADKKPTHVAVAFDVHAKTFRHKMYDDYKAGRKPMPDDLAVQIPILKEILAAMNIRICEMAGYEADDVIGTLAKRFSMQTFIYTGDRDAYQLVDATTNVCYTKRGVSDLLELSEENFYDEIGLSPSQIIDLKALMGDKSDNIPGVAGVGEKSAYSLLAAYNDLDGVYANIEEIKGALQKKLIDNKETAYFSKQLATINTDAPIEVKIEECLLKMPFGAKVKEQFANLEFKSLLSMDIFSSESDENPVSALIEPAVSETTLETVQAALKLCEEFQEERIAVDWTDKGFRFFLRHKKPEIEKECVEYFLPIKEGLLDVGVYEYQLVPLLKAVFSGEKKVIVYNSKEARHRLIEAGITASAPLEDVAILKCLADGLGNTDSLDTCLQLCNLSTEHRAYGIYRLYEIYFSKLNENEIKLYREIELPLSEVLFDMEQHGISVNEKALSDFSAKYRAELQELTEKIHALANENFNINSTQQLGKILFEKLRIGSSVKKAKTSKSYKTTAEELEKYVDEHEIIPLILRYRQVQKLNSTYVEGFKPLVKEGKVHTTYSQINTSTGRLSSANPNLQNIPVRTDEGRELRKLFMASEGCVLLDADYSQIELRLLAHFSKCKELIEAFKSGKDIHAITASQVFDVPLFEVTPQMRRSAKAVNFGIIYGISAFGLSKDLSISSRQAQAYIDRYFATYTSVKEYMTESVEYAKGNGGTKTLLGRRRVINELKSSNHNLRAFGERAAMNMPLQGSSADIIKMAMIGVYKRLKEGGYKAKLVLQVHDELLIDCPENETEKVSKILKEEMENATQLLVPMTVEVGVGKTWYDAK